MSWTAYFRKNWLVLLLCVGCLTVGTPPSLTVLWTSSEFSPHKRMPGTQPVHAHPQLHGIFPYKQAYALWHLLAMSHHLAGEATAPGSQCQSITAKGKKAGQDRAGNGKHSHMREPRGMEMQNVRLDVLKIKDIRTRNQADWPLSGMQ